MRRRRHNSTDEEFRRLERAWRSGEPGAAAGIATMNLRGQISLEQIAAMIGAATPRRAIAEAEYLLVDGWHKLDTPEARRSWTELAGSRDDFDRWLATVIKRKIISESWAIIACEAMGRPWPAGYSESGGYGLNELRPDGDNTGSEDYISPIIVFALNDKLDHAVRLMGPFYHGRNIERATIDEDWISDPSEVEDYIDEGLCSYADLTTVALRHGFESVEEWVRVNLGDPTPLFPNPIKDRAQFAASLWDTITSYSGPPGDTHGFTWDEFSRRYALEIAWENAGWLR